MVIPLGKRVGEIPWSEIASIRKVNYYGQHIYIKLKHPEKYVNQLKGMSKDFTGIYLNDSKLEIFQLFGPRVGRHPAGLDVQLGHPAVVALEEGKDFLICIL